VAIELLTHNVPKSATLGGLRKLTLPQMSHSLAHENLSGLRNDRPDAALVKLPSMYDQEQNGRCPNIVLQKLGVRGPPCPSCVRRRQAAVMEGGGGGETESGGLTTNVRLS
jgi:hypothetical protein